MSVIYMDLCLGTVQLGMAYGVANTTGRPTQRQSLDMLHHAVNKGVTVFDTANAYGAAEDRLGLFLKECKEPVRVITKLKPHLFEQPRQDVAGVIRRELEESLARLGLDFVDGYSLHTPAYIRRKDVMKALSAVKQAGLTKHIGLSIYEMEDGFAAAESGVVDYMQLPYSIFDQRARHSGLLQKAKEAGITIFARSAFVQGLALLPEEKIPDRVKGFVPHSRNFHTLKEKYGLDSIGAMLAFIRESENIDYLIFGADTIGQLDENIDKFNTGPLPAGFMDEAAALFQDIDKNIILPSLWDKE